MNILRFFVSGCVAVILLVLTGSTALAGGDPPFGSGNTAQETEPIEFRASSTFVPDFESVVAPERDHNEHSSNSTELPCARIGIVSIEEDGTENFGCVFYYHCGGERIDDAFSGELSGQSPGVYADFLVNYSPEVLGPIDVDDLNETFLDATLGEAPNDLDLPVFYYCRVGQGGQVETGDPDYSPSFGWDTTVDSEYDIPALTGLLLDEAVALLEAAPPQIRMTPPVEKRTTIVRFPSWFWINQPASLIELYAEGDRGTVLIEGRATLDHVEWQLGDVTLNCTLDQMIAFNDAEHHVNDDRPYCSHIFETRGDWELAATTHYNVEQRVTRRLAEAGVYDVGDWEPHPSSPTYAVTTTIGTMQTREILSVNTPITEDG